MSGQSIYINPVNEANEGIICFGKYRPWNHHRSLGGDRSDYPNYSGRLLDLKDGHQSGLDYFSGFIGPHLGEGFAIATVPSHDPEKVDSGIKRLARALASNSNRVDATSCLVRHTKVAKLAHGGNRDVLVHLHSIRVENSHLFAGRRVLVLDDIMTTGNSLTACRQLLQAAGATIVRCAALERLTKPVLGC